MGKRGPQARGTMRPVDIQPKQKPRPLPGMTAPARAVWKRVVDAHPAEFFKPQHLDQLRAYCEAAALHKQATSEIAKQGAVITQRNGVVKANPWCTIQTTAAQTMASMGTKLGINNNSTRKSGEIEEKKPASKRKGLMFGG